MSLDVCETNLHWAGHALPLCSHSPSSSWPQSRHCLVSGLFSDFVLTPPSIIPTSYDPSPCTLSPPCLSAFTPTPNHQSGHPSLPLIHQESERGVSERGGAFGSAGEALRPEGGCFSHVAGWRLTSCPVEGGKLVGPASGQAGSPGASPWACPAGRLPGSPGALTLAGGGEMNETMTEGLTGIQESLLSVSSNMRDAPETQG